MCVLRGSCSTQYPLRPRISWKYSTIMRALMLKSLQFMSYSFKTPFFNPTVIVRMSHPNIGTSLNFSLSWCHGRRSCWRMYLWKLKLKRSCPSFVGYMLYCIMTDTPFNYAYFIAKRMGALDYNNEPLPFARLMTHIFDYIKSKHPNDPSRMIEVWWCESNGGSLHNGLSWLLNPSCSIILDHLVASPL